VSACEYVQKLWKKKQSHMTNFLLRTCCYHQNKVYRLEHKAKQGYGNFFSPVEFIWMHHSAFKHMVVNIAMCSKPLHCGFKMVKFARSLQYVAEEWAGCHTKSGAPFGCLKIPLIIRCSTQVLPKHSELFIYCLLLTNHVFYKLFSLGKLSAFKSWPLSDALLSFPIQSCRMGFSPVILYAVYMSFTYRAVPHLLFVIPVGVAE
uniref:Large ribosomal subunit protein eL15 n=1 Tax=Strigops habroptila TaxID=2489341 RepID=A0A672U757_STRHB